MKILVCLPFCLPFPLNLFRPSLSIELKVGPTSKLAYISEPLCIGCGICVKKCPFEAIQIINLPKGTIN